MWQDSEALGGTGQDVEARGRMVRHGAGWAGMGQHRARCGGMRQDGQTWGGRGHEKEQSWSSSRSQKEEADVFTLGCHPAALPYAQKKCSCVNIQKGRRINPVSHN